MPKEPEMIEIEKGSTNVYEDLGLPDAAEMQVKATLAAKIGEIIKLVGMMKERMEWIVPTSEIIYKFASVAFFDSSESPYSYDPEYCKAKIQRWKEAADISDFFIVTRLKDMVPLPTLSEADLKICLSIVDQIAGAHSKSAQA